MPRPSRLSSFLKMAAERTAWPVVMVMAGAMTLTGCASVADDPTVPAFARVAADSRGAFATARQGEQDTFADQARAALKTNPSTIILSASSNDLGQDSDAVSAAMSDLLHSVHDTQPRVTIIAVSAVWGSTAAPPS